MTAPSAILSLARDQTGAAAAEFAMVLPLMLLFLFGIIDVGGYGWKINKGEKATQIGARMAVVTDVIDSAMVSYDFTGTYGQGNPIPASALGVETCDASGCTCSPACPWTPSYQGAAFTRIVNRMRDIDPAIQASNVLVEYRGSGLGYAGDPNGPQIAPLVTVKLKGMTYRPISLFLFNVNMPLPSFAYTLTMEDGNGVVSN